SVGKARLLEPMRDQVELRSMDIDSLIGEDHPARLIWAYVEQLDLRELEDAIKAREGTPGHPAITPRLLLALWLYATSQGVGSARALARLCERHDALSLAAGRGIGELPHAERLPRRPRRSCRPAVEGECLERAGRHRRRDVD